MSAELTEEEMRRALFGLGSVKAGQDASVGVVSTPATPATNPTPSSGPRPKSRPLTPKLRVTMNVTKTFEGLVEVFVYEADTLSTLVAEQEAKKAAKKKRFQYFEIVSIEPTA